MVQRGGRWNPVGGVRLRPLRHIFAVGAALGFLFTLPVPPAVLAGDPGSLEGRVRERRLANGLTVLALRREGAPTVSLQIAYRVGSVDEEPGGTGMAHLLEHMLFKGTRVLGTLDWERERPILRAIEAAGKQLDAERRKGDAADSARVAALEQRLAELQRAHRPLVIKDEIDAIYARNGAVGFNAFTSADQTSYVVSLTSNRLELWASLEAERMRDPVLREYYVERSVVQEERRQRYDTDPGGRLYEALLSTAYSAHPYGNPVIGWPADLETLDIDATRAFHRTHYGPDNAVIAAVGDVDPEAFFALVERYFGDLPPTGGQRPAWKAVEPPQTRARRVEITHDAEPRLIVAYHKPTLPHRDDYVFDVVAAILSDGRTSRLVRELVDRRRLAASVHASNGVPGARYPNLFAVFLSPLNGVTTAALEEALEGELQRLTQEPPSAAELERVRRRMEAERVRALLSNVGLVRRLSYFQTIAGDWRYAESHLRVLETITAEEVAEVAARYFTARNRTVAVLRPAQGEDG